MILKIKILFAYIKYFILLYRFWKSDNKFSIMADIWRWDQELSIGNHSINYKLIFLLSFRPQFRNLFFYRIQSHSNFLHSLCKPDPSLAIADDCGIIEGGAIYFEHAFGSHIALNYIGRGAIIRQLTTFGVKSKNRHSERPWIGRNVDFGANVNCIGNIRIGDNAIIGVGSVVVKDIPANAIVVGNPAKIIKY